MDPITERLAYVEEAPAFLCRCAFPRYDHTCESYEAGDVRYITVARPISRSNRGAQYVQEMGAVVALAGDW